MNRRGFLTAAAGIIAAPAIVKAENIMKIVVPRAPELDVGEVEYWRLKIDDVDRLELNQLGEYTAKAEKAFESIVSRIGRYPSTTAPGPYLNAWEQAYHCEPSIGEIATQQTLQPLRECGETIETKAQRLWGYWGPGEPTCKDFPEFLDVLQETTPLPRRDIPEIYPVSPRLLSGRPLVFPQ